MRRWLRVVLGLLLVGSFGAVLTALVHRYSPNAWSPSPAAPVLPRRADTIVPGMELVAEEVTLRRGDNIDGLLARAGAAQSSRVAMVAAIRKAFDVKKFRAGSQLTFTRTPSGTLESLEYVIDPDRKLELHRNGDGYEAVIADIPGIITTVTVSGTIHGSLFESIQRAGESPELAIRMALEIFAWDIDFYTDPREGDEFRLLVEKKQYANGQPPTYRRILAASYRNRGTLHEGFLFPDPQGKAQYYSRDGRSLQAAFLRSPLKFNARVSSHFSYNRRHPVLKIHRPHLGTDYAAPTGSPVQSVASGRVFFSGRTKASGNMVKIRHANGFETYYLHLSRRFVKKGARVSQGQRIGLVGATGLATGPHLDFRVRKNGQFVNFERMKPPRKSRITAAQMAAFTADRDRYSALLNHTPAGEAPLLAAGASTVTGPSAP